MDKCWVLEFYDYDSGPYLIDLFKNKPTVEQLSSVEYNFSSPAISELLEFGIYSIYSQFGGSYCLEERELK